MLHLHNASAGSGKTYTLARTYIKLMLGERIALPSATNEERYRLRSDQEIIDAHSHILAVTFTNKATNEMKMRIVRALYNLAYADSANFREVEYMEYFMSVFSASQKAISNAALTALREVLEYYTNFQVSTIDSFFQTILRSFAYETDLNEDYGIELDDDYINSEGWSSTFLALRDNTPAGREIQHWLKMLMVNSIKDGLKWNLLGKDSSYRDLVKFTALISKESFKEVRAQLDDYFEKHNDFIAEGEKIVGLAKQWLRNAFIDVAKIADDFQTKYSTEKYISSYFFTTLDRVAKAGDGTNNILIVDKTHKYYRRQEGYKKDGDNDRDRALLKKGATAKLGTKADEILSLANMFYQAVEQWQAAVREISKVCDFIPRLGLLKWVLKAISEFRKENNLVQLSDTNAMLSRIINLDDVPFIYEKVGAHINHYLIDEFQDTSAMQWHNLKPLLMQSVSEGNENLIIGDAKQSIYRFRNADFALISSKVPRDQNLSIYTLLHGRSANENKNYRSAATIVNFNNQFIVCLAKKMLEKANQAGNVAFEDMQQLYEAAPQEVIKSERQGYVELCLKTDSNCLMMPKPDEDNKEIKVPNVAELIANLIQRGYRQEEIAILVRTNEQGALIIDNLMNYNDKATPEQPKINFISDDSLKINKARSIKIIMSLLARYVHNRNNEPLTVSSQKNNAYPNNSDKFSDNINNILGQHPELTVSEAIKLCIEGDLTLNDADDFTLHIDNMILPAIIERIIGSKFIGDSLRQEEAPYLAAFQDKVLDYSSRYPADVASFVKWWKDNGDRFSISSSAATEAVNILTIHRAKGLEYRCVIIPWVDFRLLPYKEKMWIKPTNESLFPLASKSFLAHYAQQLPPAIPLEINQSLEGTSLERYYRQIQLEVSLESLNDIYVAFTRAIDELYIFADEEAEKNNTDKLIISTFKNLYGDSLSCGVMPNEHQILKGRKHEYSQENDFDAISLDNYNVNLNIPKIICREADTKYILSDVGDEVINKKFEGTMMHRIMSSIKNSLTAKNDIAKAIVKEKVKGTLLDSEQQEVKAYINNKIEEAINNGWFSPLATTYNERTIFFNGNQYRPDRIEIINFKQVKVLDYKFGALKKAEHIRQVRDYIEILVNSKKYKNVEGWIWYVDLNEWIKV